MKTLYFITSNKGKILEAKEKFSDLNIDIVQKDLGYPEIQTDTLEDVAIFGVDHICEKFKKPFINYIKDIATGRAKSSDILEVPGIGNIDRLEFLIKEEVINGGLLDNPNEK